MKAITLTQPWATLVAIGAKGLETRSWATSYRGPLAIHAAAGLASIGGQRGLSTLCSSYPFSEYLMDHWPLPLGSVIAVCRLVSIHRITAAGVEGFRPQPPPNEIAFGDYSPGRYAWLLADVRALPEPIPAKGALSLWEWTPPEGWE